MIFAQDGSGTATKLEDGYTAGYIDGTILSIKSRNSDTLPQVVTSMLTNHPGKELFLDTHFYASQIAMTTPGKIPDYQLYQPGLNRKDFSIKNISSYAQRLIDYQRELGLTNVIVPSLTIANFDDYTSQISLQLYEASMDYIGSLSGGTPVKPYLSLAFHENALLDNEKLSQYLDDITLIEGVAGFYIVVERNVNSLPQWQDNRTLAKLMYVVNALSENYEVVCGFMDFPGMLMLGAGAKHVASGWHQTLRHYTCNYFLETGGRSNGTFRYPSKALLAEILSVPDLQNIIRRGFSAAHIDPAYGAGLADPDNLVFQPPTRILQQWKTFKELGQQITAAADPMSEIEQLISTAETNLAALQGAGIVIDRASVSHYETWKQAIALYRNGVL